MNQPIPKCTVGAVTAWYSGGTPNRARRDYWNGDIPWISASTLKDSEISTSNQFLSSEAVAAGSKMAQIGSTLLLVRGSALHNEIRAGLVISPVAFNQDVKALAPKRGLVPKYLTHVIRGSESELLKLVTSAGNTAGVLDTKIVQSFEIYFPNESEQRVLVAALDNADNMIAALERLIAKKRAIKHGMMQQLLTGKTRLPGFTSPWQVRRLDEVLSYEQPGRFLVKTSKQLDSGRVPVLTAGKTFVLGYTNETQGLYSAHPVIIFDDFTTASKYVDFDFKAKSSAMKILSAKDGVELRFLYERMQLIDFPLSDHKRYWISEYSKQDVLMPGLEEQVAITSVISDADAELENLQSEASKAHAIKQGMMQELLTGRTRLPVAEAA